MDILQQFYDNKAMHNTVRTFLEEQVKSLALERLFSGKEAKDVAAAKDVLDRAFSALREAYEPKKTFTLTNHAK